MDLPMKAHCVVYVCPCHGKFKRLRDLWEKIVPAPSDDEFMAEFKKLMAMPEDEFLEE